MTLFYCLVHTPVTNLSMSDISTTTITVKWTSPSSEDGNYVTYYNISYSPSCPELLSVNMTLVSVIPQSIHYNIQLYIKRIIQWYELYYHSESW